MIEFFEFGRHAPYIFAAYGFSILAIAILILIRKDELKKALDAEPRPENEEKQVK